MNGASGAFTLLLDRPRSRRPFVDRVALLLAGVAHIARLATVLSDGITERFVRCPTLLVSSGVGKREDIPSFESGEQDAQGNVPEAHMPKAQQFQVRELNLRLAEARNEVHSARRVAQALGCSNTVLYNYKLRHRSQRHLNNLHQ